VPPDFPSLPGYSEPPWPSPFNSSELAQLASRFPTDPLGTIWSFMSMNMGSIFLQALITVFIYFVSLAHTKSTMAAGFIMIFISLVFTLLTPFRVLGLLSLAFGAGSLCLRVLGK